MTHSRFIKASLIAGATALTILGSGCTNNEEMDALRSQIRQADSKAEQAQTAAANAQRTASDAQRAAASAQSAAERAERAAAEAKACCAENSERINRAFQKSQEK